MSTGRAQRTVACLLQAATVLGACALGTVTGCSSQVSDGSGAAAQKRLPPLVDPGPTLSIGLDGCFTLELAADARTLRCALDPLKTPREERLRIVVRDRTDAALSIDCPDCQATACESGTAASVSSPKGRCRDLRPGALVRLETVRVSLSARGQLLGERIIELSRSPRTAVDELQQCWRDARGPGELLDLVERANKLAAAQPVGPLADRARLLAALIRYDRLRSMEAQGAIPQAEAEQSIALLEQALEVARQRRWLRAQADLSEALSWLYFNQSEDAVPRIERLLIGQEWPALLPAQKVHCELYLAFVALERQDLRRVQRYVSEASADADLLHDAELAKKLLELHAAELEKVVLTGSAAEITASLRDLTAGSKQPTAKPCDQAYLWASVGWLQLLLLELGWPGAADPSPALERARALRVTTCSTEHVHDKLRLAHIWVNLARARSAVWWRRRELTDAQRQAAAQATREALRGMREVLGEQKEPDPLRLERLLCEVRARLLEGAPRLALKQHDELAQLLPSKQSPLDTWMVLLHRAEALEDSGQTDRAISTLRQADEQLLTLQHQVPIYQAHRLMLSRFGFGSQRAIELALRVGRRAEALEILRQAGQRDLGLTTQPWWPEQVGGDAAGRWKSRLEAQNRYLELRREYEARIAHASTLTAAQCQDLKTAKTRWLGSLDALFAAPKPALFKPPPLPKGELLLGCTRQSEGWVCFASSEGAPAVVNLPVPELDVKAVEGLLLPALAERIRRASRLRVLAQGRLAELDMAALRFGDRPLGIQKPILYSLDRPPPPPPPSAKQALVVLKPEGDIPELSIERAQRLLEPALRGVSVETRSATSRFASPIGWRRGEALSSAVLSNLQQSNLFIYFGHVDPMPCPTYTPLCADAGVGALLPDHRLTALCLTQNTALSVSDVLAAPWGPQRVFLLGCASTDRSSSTPTEIMGLGQSFAMRGAQVLALARPMDAPQAEELLCALGQERLSSPGFDFGRFVMETQQRLLRGERCKALGRWHTPQCSQAQGNCVEPSDWSALRWYGP